MAKNIIKAKLVEGEWQFYIDNDRLDGLVIDGLEVSLNDKSLNDLVLDFDWDNRKPKNEGDTKYLLGGELLQLFFLNYLKNVISTIKISDTENANIYNGIADLSTLVPSYIVNNLDNGTVSSNTVASSQEVYTNLIDLILFVSEYPSELDTSSDQGIWYEEEPITDSQVKYGLIALKISLKGGKVYYSRPHNIEGISNVTVVYPQLSVGLANNNSSIINSNYLNKSENVYLNYSIKTRIENGTGNEYYSLQNSTLSVRVTSGSNIIFSSNIEILEQDDVRGSIQIPLSGQTNITVETSLITPWEEENTSDLKVTTTTSRTVKANLIDMALNWRSNISTYGDKLFWSGQEGSLSISLLYEASVISGAKLHLIRVAEDANELISETTISSGYREIRINDSDCVNKNGINKFLLVAKQGSISSNYLYIEIPYGNINEPQICLQFSDSSFNVEELDLQHYIPQITVLLFSPITINYYICNPVQGTGQRVNFISSRNGADFILDTKVLPRSYGNFSHIVTKYEEGASHNVTFLHGNIHKIIQLNINELQGVISYNAKPSQDYSALYKSNDELNRATWENKGTGNDLDAILSNVSFTSDSSGWHKSTNLGDPDYLELSNGASVLIPRIFHNGETSGRTIEMLVKFDNCLDTSLDCITVENSEHVKLCAISPDRIKFGYVLMAGDQINSSQFVTAPISYGNWIHITMVIDGSETSEFNTGKTIFYNDETSSKRWNPYFSVYINGVRSSLKMLTSDELSNFQIARDLLITSSSSNVLVSYIRAYDAPLTSDLILSLCNTAYGTTSLISVNVQKDNVLETTSSPNINFETYKQNHCVVLIDGDMLAFNYSILKKDAIIAKYLAIIPAANTKTTKQIMSDSSDTYKEISVSLYPELLILGTSSRVYPIHNIRWYAKHKAQGKMSKYYDSKGDVGYTDGSFTKEGGWYRVAKKESKHIFEYPTNCVIHPDSVNFTKGIMEMKFNNITYHSLFDDNNKELVSFLIDPRKFKVSGENKYVLTDLKFTYEDLEYLCLLSRLYLGEYDSEKGYSLTKTKLLIKDGGTLCIEENNSTETLLELEEVGSYKFISLESKIDVDNGIRITEAGKSKVLCFKADYVDSSGTHNTGTCAAINYTYDTNKDCAPPSHNLNKNYLSGIEGIPVDIFWVNTNPNTPGYYKANDDDAYYYWQDKKYKVYTNNNTPNYVGKYMLNQDKKSSGDLFGFYEFDDFEKVDYYDNATPNLCIEVGTNRLLWTNWLPIDVKDLNKQMISQNSPLFDESDISWDEWKKSLEYRQSKWNDLDDITKNQYYDPSYSGDYSLYSIPAGDSVTPDLPNNWNKTLVKKYFDNTLVNTHNDLSIPYDVKITSGDGDSSSELPWEVRNYNTPDGGDYADGDTLTDILKNNSLQGDLIAQQWAELCLYIWACFKETPGFNYWDNRIMNYNSAICGFTGYKQTLEDWVEAINYGNDKYWRVVESNASNIPIKFQSHDGAYTIKWNTTEFIYEGGIYDKEIYWPKTCAELKGYPGTNSTDPIYKNNTFTNTVSKHFNVPNLCLWYIYTETYLALDLRTKNCTLATWDVLLRNSENEENLALAQIVDTNSSIKYAHWNFIPYDCDTVLGVNNNGKSIDDLGNFTVPYNTTENTLDADNLPCFAGHSNCLWKLVRANLTGAYESTDLNTLSGVAKILVTKEMKDKWKECYNSIANNWPNAIYNKDLELKYLLPFTEETYSRRTPTDTYIFTTSFIDNILGNADLFRNLLIDNCHSYLYGKYGSGGSDFCGIPAIKAIQCFSVQGKTSNNCWVNGILQAANQETTNVNFEVLDASYLPNVVFSGMENLAELQISTINNRFVFPSAIHLQKGSHEENCLSKLHTIRINLENADPSNNNSFSLEDVQNNVKLIGLKNFIISNSNNEINWSSINLQTSPYIESILIGNNQVILTITPLKAANLYLLDIPAPKNGLSLESCTRLTYKTLDTNNTLILRGKFTNDVRININNCPGINVEDFCNDFIQSWATLSTLEISNQVITGDGTIFKRLKDSGLQINKIKFENCIYKLTNYSVVDDNEGLYAYIKLFCGEGKLILEEPVFSAYLLLYAGKNTTWKDQWVMTNTDNNTLARSVYTRNTALFGSNAGMIYYPDNYKISGHIKRINDERHRYLVNFGDDKSIQDIILLNDSDATKTITGTKWLNNSEYDNYDVMTYEPEYWYKGISVETDKDGNKNFYKYYLYSTQDKSYINEAKDFETYILTNDDIIQEVDSVSSRKGSIIGSSINSKYSGGTVHINDYCSLKRESFYVWGIYTALDKIITRTHIINTNDESYNRSYTIKLPKFESGKKYYLLGPGQNAISKMVCEVTFAKATLLEQELVTVEGETIDVGVIPWIKHEACLIGSLKGTLEDTRLRSKNNKNIIDTYNLYTLDSENNPIGLNQGCINAFNEIALESMTYEDFKDIYNFTTVMFGTPFVLSRMDVRQIDSNIEIGSLLNCPMTDIPKYNNVELKFTSNIFGYEGMFGKNLIAELLDIISAESDIIKYNERFLFVEKTLKKGLSSFGTYADIMLYSGTSANLIDYTNHQIINNNNNLVLTNIDTTKDLRTEAPLYSTPFRLTTDYNKIVYYRQSNLPSGQTLIDEWITLKRSTCITKRLAYHNSEDIKILVNKANDVANSSN